MDLMEITVTTAPAYPQTSLALRSLPDSMRSMVSCICPCSQCLAGACNICSTPSCDFPGCKCPETNAKKTLTKTVDGESLTADCFLIVGDPKKTDTWKLPVKFSTDEKTKSHLRDVISRFSELDGVSDEEKKAAWDKLVSLCTHYGITVSSDDERASKHNLELRLKLHQLRSR